MVEHCAAHGHGFCHPELHDGRRVWRCENCGNEVEALVVNHDAMCEAPWPRNCATRADLPEELLPIFKEPVADSTPYDSGKMWE